jgi:DNA-binding transcriptional LysR family regulator
MLSLYKLEVFLAVAQEGKISRAAERLFMTQAAVSQHIHDLEASLGVALFSRHSQGVILTVAGETLLGYAKNIVWTIAAAENALTEVKNLKEGMLVIGLTSTAASLLLPDWLGGFREQYPSIKVSAQTNITPALEQALLEKQIDLAFVEGEIQNPIRLHVMELLETQIFVAVGGSHPWAVQKSVSIHDLAREPYLSRQGSSHTHSWMMELFARFGLKPNIVAEFDNPYAIQRAIVQGMGVSLMPACLVREDETQGRLRLLPITELPDLRRSLKAIWLNELPLKPIPRAFLDFLAQTYPQLKIPNMRESLPAPHLT